MIIRRRYLSDDGDEFDQFSNRSGLVNYGSFNKSSYSNVCFYPFYNILIDSNGDVVACSHDWGKKKIFGNIYEESILDIWFGGKMHEFRKQMSEAPRNSEPCNTCNVHGQRYGEINYEEWKANEF